MNRIQYDTVHLPHSPQLDVVRCLPSSIIHYHQLSRLSLGSLKRFSR